jgi:hypothetical protein
MPVMANSPLYHQTARDGRGGIPAWWFGAPFIAFVYAFLTPGVLPDIVAVPEALPPGLATALRWLVGLLLGVVLLSCWQVVQWARRAGR